MSLSELFKPWLGSCSACATPRPNVALVLQYLQALRVSMALSLKKRKNKQTYFTPLRFFFLQKLLFFVFLGVLGFEPSSYGHTTVKAPHPIRTAKLSTVGPDQYFGRGLQGNLGCCMSFLFFFLLLGNQLFAAKANFLLARRLRVPVARFTQNRISLYSRIKKGIFMKQRKNELKNY